MYRPIQTFQVLSKIKQFIDSAFGTPAPERVRFVEVGDFEDYLNGHLPKAIFLGFHNSDQNIRKLLPNLGSEIILYSEKNNPEELEEFAKHLLSLGYFEIYIYYAGKKEWISQGQALEYSLVPADHFRQVS